MTKESDRELSRRTFVAMTSAVSAACMSLGAENVQAAAKSPKKKPDGKLKPRRNILFVFTDQERYITQWPKQYHLPGHERLAREGTTFTSHYVSASMCTSSRSVMLTGLQTADNGMFDNVDCPYIKTMSPKIPTVGHMLRKAGYFTAYRGKWHLGREFGGHHPDEALIAKMEEYGFSDFFSPGDGAAHDLGGYASDALIGASAISWLRQKGRKLSDEGKPWSLFLSLVNPHDIMYFNADAPGENVQDTGKLLMHTARAPEHAHYAAKWHYPVPPTLKQSMGEPGRPSAHGEYLKAWSYTLGSIPLADANWDRFNDFYLNSIKQVDDQLSAVLAELDALGLQDETIVVFTADHGEMGGHHGLRGKGPFAYEESIHVPFLVRHPDVAGGSKCRALSSHIDIAPTLLSFAGIKPAEVANLAGRELPGKDISAVLENPAAADAHAIRQAALFTYSGIATNDSEMIRIIAEAKAAGKDPKAAVAETGYKPDLKKRGTLRCIVDGRYKYVRYFAPTERNSPKTLDEIFALNDVELYDLANDPRETKNLAVDRQKNGALIAEMNEKLEAGIKAEIGKDDGREMPAFPGIQWEIDRVDL